MNIEELGIVTHLDSSDQRYRHQNALRSDLETVASRRRLMYREVLTGQLKMLTMLPRCLQWAILILSICHAVRRSPLDYGPLS